LDNLGQLHMQMGRVDLAEPFFHEALEIRERELGEYAFGTSITVANLAQIAVERGELTRAVELSKRAVDIRESIGDQSEPSQTGWVHLLLANVLGRIGEWADADPHYIRAFELYRLSLGPLHPWTLTAAVHAAGRALERGDLSAATDILESVGMLGDGVFEATRSPDIPLSNLNNIGFAFWLRGEYAAARAIYQLALSRSTDPTVLNNLGMIAERLGEYPAAVEYYRQALSVLREQRASDRPSPLQARILNNLGVSLTLGGRQHRVLAALMRH
jgi:tetratricopeptide (TPR) repeat protein